MKGISISNNSEKPIYQQIFEQICSSIIKGELESDYSLPPIRTAAIELRVSIITVKKAWEELEREGLIYSIVGRGCFVSDLSEEELSEKKMDLVHRQMKKDIIFYKNLGINKEEINNLFQTKL